VAQKSYKRVEARNLLTQRGKNPGFSLFIGYYGGGLILSQNTNGFIQERHHHLQTLSSKARIPFFPLNFIAPARQPPFLRTITGP